VRRTFLSYNISGDLFVFVKLNIWFVHKWWSSCVIQMGWRLWIFFIWIFPLYQIVLFLYLISIKFYLYSCFKAIIVIESKDKYKYKTLIASSESSAYILFVKQFLCKRRLVCSQTGKSTSVVWEALASRHGHLVMFYDPKTPHISRTTTYRIEISFKTA